MNPADEAIKSFGRDGFYIRRNTKTDCPDCIKGPTGQSISKCETCDSKGYIYSYYFIPVWSIISWRKLEGRSVMIGAITVSGDCGVAITADDYKMIDKDNDEFIIDGYEVKFASVVPSDQNAVYLLGFIHKEL